MKHKYNGFLTSGKLYECIRWIEGTLPEDSKWKWRASETSGPKPAIWYADPPSPWNVQGVSTNAIPQFIPAPPRIAENMGLYSVGAQYFK
jgi:hypothetical protein